MEEMARLLLLGVGAEGSKDSGRITAIRFLTGPEEVAVVAVVAVVRWCLVR